MGLIIFRVSQSEERKNGSAVKEMKNFDYDHPKK